MRHLRRVAVGAAAVVVAGGVSIAMTPSAQAANVLDDPGFESTSLGPWTCDAGGSVVTSPVHSGARSLVGTATDATTGECRQTVTVQPNAMYTLSGWVRGDYTFLGARGDD